MIATEPRVQESAAPAESIRLTIHVTAEDIQRGERMANDRCAIALAMLRAFEAPPSEFFPHVNAETVWLPSGKVVELPLSAQLFIIAFDYRQRVEPFSFDLLIPLDAAA